MLLLAATVTAIAQNWNDPKYLTGAVPLNEQGVVVFHADYVVPGKSRADIYAALKNYVETQVLKGPEALTQCHLVEADEADGLLAALLDRMRQT